MPDNKCSFPGCTATFDPAIAGVDPGDGHGFYTGWCFSPDEDPELPGHDHEVRS